MQAGESVSTAQQNGAHVAFIPERVECFLEYQVEPLGAFCRVGLINDEDETSSVQ